MLTEQPACMKQSFPDEYPGKHDSKLAIRNINKSHYNCVHYLFLCWIYGGFVFFFLWVKGLIGCLPTVLRRIAKS